MIKRRTFPNRHKEGIIPKVILFLNNLHNGQHRDDEHLLLADNCLLGLCGGNNVVKSKTLANIYGVY